jgi:hypothetical protein
VSDLVGPECEALIYRFCTIDRHDLIYTQLLDKVGGTGCNAGWGCPTQAGCVGFATHVALCHGGCGGVCASGMLYDGNNSQQGQLGL